MKHYVGLDISMKETFICIEDETGKILHQGRVKTDPALIAIYLRKFDLNLEKVGLESGSLSHWLTKELRALDIPAICIDARKMAAVLSVQVNKTDKNDARGIADAMRCNLYREVMSKSPRSLDITNLMRSRRTMVDQKIQLTNTIRGLLKAYGIRLGLCGDTLFTEKVRATLSPENPLTALGIEGLLNCFEQFCKEIKKLTKKIEELVREDEDAKRLMTIPGIGPITAMAFKVEIDNPKRFKNSRAVGAYLGMTPRQYSSGENQKQGRISKCGSREVRRLLNEAAVVMLTRSKRWSKLKAWGLKIHRKHGFKKACMAVGRKLAVVMHHMLINEAEFIYGEPKESMERAI
jgi:transposase